MGHAFFTGGRGCLKKLWRHFQQARSHVLRVFRRQQPFLTSQPLDAGPDRFSRVLRKPFCHGPDAGLDVVLVLLPDVLHDVAVDLADV